MNNPNNLDQNTNPNNNRYSKLENGMRYLRNDQFFVCSGMGCWGS